MKSAVSTITNYASQTAQSIHLPLDDKTTLKSNFDSVISLFETLGESDNTIKERTECWSDVNHKTVIKFYKV